MSDHEHLSSRRILDLAESSIPQLGGAILGRSPVDWDEDYWTGILNDADQQADQSRQRSFSDFGDLMTILAHHDRHLIDGRDSVRSARASEALALHVQASAGSAVLTQGAARRFEETLALVLESLGADSSVVGARPQLDSIRGIRTVVVEFESLRAQADVWSATGPKSDGSLISPLHSIRFENLSGTTLDVETVSLSGKGMPAWTLENIRLAVGEVRLFEPHELDWKLGPGEPGTTELEFGVGIPGRSRAGTVSLEILRRGIITRDSVPWLLAANTPTADPLIDSLLGSIPDEPEFASSAGSDGLLLFEAIGRQLDAKFRCGDDPVSDDGSVELRSPQSLSAAHDLTVSERAVLLAAAMERTGLPAFLVQTKNGIRAAWGEPDDTTAAWTQSPGVIGSNLARLKLSGFDGPPEDVYCIVDLEQAREVIGPDEIDSKRSRPTDRVVSEVSSVPAAITKWKKELLNLTFTNRQLRMSPASGLRIPLPGDFLPEFVDLLSSGATFDFVSKTELTGSSRGDVTNDAVREGLNKGLLCGLPLSSGFGTRMTQVSSAVRTARAESGMNILHAAIGLLDWVQDSKGKRGLSPIILVPLQLSGSARTGYRIALEAGTTPSINTALSEKLGLITGRRLASLDQPAVDSRGLDIEEVLRSVAAEMSRLPIDGRVVPEVRVMTASHANAPMWKDLQDNWRSIMNKPVPRHLVSGTGTRFNDPVPIRTVRTEDEFKTHLVSRVDGPQLDAVVNAARGSSFVLEGPPGTGKSQTITNMIAAGIARGRKILFVAEKKAALDVVLTRLREAGLADLVLDLHDTKQSMNAVRDTLKRSLRAEGRSLPDTVEKKQRRLAAIIGELDNYPKLLLREDGSESVWSLFRSWTEQLAEFNPDNGWQPEEIDSSMALDGVSVARLKDLIRGYRRALRASSESAGHANAAVPIERPSAFLDRLRQEGLAGVAASLDSGRDVYQLPSAIDLAAARGRLDAEILRHGLGSLSGDHRQHLVEQYLAEVAELEQLWRDHLSAAAIRRRNHEIGNKLSHEFIAQLARRTGGKVRTLFEEHGKEVLWSTPCVLMSPSGVSKHIPLGAVEFDTVIFDESSQIVPSTAIGALARANSAIFVGDRRQMPPPTEFLSSGDGDLLDELGEETGENHVGRMKSILTLATAAGFEKRRLTWHYRSRDERLIEFSNRKFYEGTLTTIPSAPAADGTHPVRSVFVGGEYVKIPGSSKGNPEEARAVIAEVERTISTDPSKSIMVVTFNSTQRDYIESLLIESGSEQVQAAFERESEPLAIKNVDNVQGDERDIVLFSTVYAPDRATGNLTQNFGPLNRPGGENRFNVAVTRARDRILMFTSLKSSDLDLRTSSSKGLRSLKEYLKAAEDGSNPSVTAATDSGDLYRDQVARALTSRGLEVRTGVGASTFRVDLAVKRPGNQEWLAVLLDSKEWAEQSSVRDRDGTATGNLHRSRGWSGVYRILVPEWTMSPETVISEILKLVETDNALSSAAEQFEVSKGYTGVAAVEVSEPDAAAQSIEEDSVREEIPVPLAEPVNSTVRQVVYREAPVTRAGSRELLLSAEKNFVARNVVREQIIDILTVQGPTELSSLSRQVARRFGAVKLTKPVAEAVEVCIPGDVTSDPLATIVWPPELSPDSYREYRVPAEGAPARNFAEIGIQEMANAIVDVLSGPATFDMLGEEIENEVSGVFGLTSSSKDSRARIRKSLEFCLQSGVIEQDSQKRYFSPEPQAVATESTRTESPLTPVVRSETMMVMEEDTGFSTDVSKQQSSQLIWTEEEMILAADLADDRDWRGPNSATPEVLELSELLKQAHFYPHQGRPENFRSPSSVSRKVGNLIGSHPTKAPANSLRTSAREVPIVQRFIDDRASMKALARSIRERIRRGEL